MGMITIIVLGVGGVIASIFMGAVSQQVADEFKAWTPRICARLLRHAVARLPETKRERMAEEWAAYVADTPGHAMKIWEAFGCWRAARVAARRTFIPFGLRFLRAHPRQDCRLIAAMLEAMDHYDRTKGAGRESASISRRRAWVREYWSQQVLWRHIFRFRIAIVLDWLFADGTMRAGTAIGDAVGQLRYTRRSGKPPSWAVRRQVRQRIVLAKSERPEST